MLQVFLLTAEAVSSVAKRDSLNAHNNICKALYIKINLSATVGAKSCIKFLIK